MVSAKLTGESEFFLRQWCRGWLHGEFGIEASSSHTDGDWFVACVEEIPDPGHLHHKSRLLEIKRELARRIAKPRRALALVGGFYLYVSSVELYGVFLKVGFDRMEDMGRQPIKDCRWPIPGEEVADFPASDPLRLALDPQRERKEVVEEAWIAVLREMERRGRIDEVPSIFCAPALHDVRVLEEEIEEVMGAVSRHPLAIDTSDLVKAMKASVPFLQEVVHGTEKLKSAVLNMEVKLPDPVFGSARAGASISLEECRRRVAEDIRNGERSPGIVYELAFAPFKQERDEAFKKLSKEIERGPKPTITPHTWDFGAFTTREDEGRRLPTLEEAADTASRLLDSFGVDSEEFPEFADALEACEMKREEVRTSLEFLTRLGDTLTDEQRAQLAALPGELLAFHGADLREKTFAAQLARAGEPNRDGDVFATDHIVLFHIQDREDADHEQQEEARGEEAQPAARGDEARAGEQGDQGARDDVRDDRDAGCDVPEEQTLLELATGLINIHGLSGALEAFAICEPLVITTLQGNLAIFARGGRLHFMFHPRHGESIGLELNELDSNDVIQACMAWLIGKRIRKGGLH